MRMQQLVDLQRLIFSNQRNNAEAGSLASLVELIFRLLDRRDHQRSDCLSLLPIHFPVSAGALHSDRDGVWTQRDARCITKRLDLAEIRQFVAELNDFGHTTKMLDQANRGTE